MFRALRRTPMASLNGMKTLCVSPIALVSADNLQPAELVKLGARLSTLRMSVPGLGRVKTVSREV
ncbi:hypothetical protein, partial [Bradyrhizobium japonicum]|uniref:hypothetical protein n=1 Tax=Bradyrhizobium japonicum TaxID=375 RepID=UPI001AEBDEB1